jgi:hypothetical protein
MQSSTSDLFAGNAQLLHSLFPGYPFVLFSEVILLDMLDDFIQKNVEGFVR